MAEGGVDFGNEKTPLLENTDDQDDGDAGPGGDQTTEFEPGASSTPAPNGNQRQTTLNRPGEEPSFYVFPDTPGISTTDAAMDIVVKEFQLVDKTKVIATIENDRVKVALIKNVKGKTVLQKSYFLTTKIRGTGEYKINSEIKGELKLALGKSRREILEEKIKKLTEGINEDQKVINGPENQTEKNKAKERKKRKIYDRTSLERELDQLKKGKYSIPSESIELQTFQKNTEERQEIFREKQLEKEKQLVIINDKNSSPEEKERASEKVNKIEQEQNQIEDEEEREIEQLPLRDRLREKVKAIFKKYGFTVGAVFLAVGTTLGVLLSSLSNGLKAVSKGVGNGLKTLGKKISEILPGLIGAVVSFVFRTAGNVVGFLGKHAWLLILAVAAFLFERVMKRRG